MVETKAYEPRGITENIDEVYPRVFMSDYLAAVTWSTLEKYGINHIVSVVNSPMKTYFEEKGVKHLIFSDIKDDRE